MDGPTPAASTATGAPSAAMFADAVGGFVGLVGLVPARAWQAPGLGVWTVRELVGHTARALTTVVDYLDAPPVPGAPVVADAVAYYVAARRVDPGAIAERGRLAGRALGDDPATSVAIAARRVLAAVHAAPGGATVTLAFGAVMGLDEYLWTRTFELAVHSLDVARAVGIEVPAGLAPAIAASVELAARIGIAGPGAPATLLALTGRPPGAFSVL